MRVHGLLTGMAGGCQMPVLISQAGGRGLKSTSQICVHLCFLRVGVLSTLDMLMDGLKHSFESQTKTVFDLHEKNHSSIC